MPRVPLPLSRNSPQDIVLHLEWTTAWTAVPSSRVLHLHQVDPSQHNQQSTHGYFNNLFWPDVSNGCWFRTVWFTTDTKLIRVVFKLCPQCWSQSYRSQCSYQLVPHVLLCPDAEKATSVHNRNLGCCPVSTNENFAHIPELHIVGTVVYVQRCVTSERLKLHYSQYN